MKHSVNADLKKAVVRRKKILAKKKQKKGWDKYTPAQQLKMRKEQDKTTRHNQEVMAEKEMDWARKERNKKRKLGDRPDG